MLSILDVVEYVAVVHYVETALAMVVILRRIAASLPISGNSLLRQIGRHIAQVVFRCVMETNFVRGELGWPSLPPESPHTFFPTTTHVHRTHRMLGVVAQLRTFPGAAIAVN